MMLKKRKSPDNLPRVYELRGTYGEGLITESIFFRLPFLLMAERGVSSLIVASDPRPSSQSLVDAIVDGAKMAGLNVFSAGVMPTPMLDKSMHLLSVDAGLMVTASHNPACDNGCKVFFKQTASSKESFDLKRLLLDSSVEPSMSRARVEDVRAQAKEAYIRSLSGFFKDSLPKLSCLFDSANGAWFPHLDVLQHLGVQVTSRQQSLNANEINNNVGSLSINKAWEDKIYKDYDCTILVDGDGDRLSLLNSQGQILDGDDILYLLRDDAGPTIVGTVLSNQSLAVALKDKDIHFVRSSVGDHLVLAALKEHQATIGGEPCGHIIDRRWLETSDPVYIFSLLAQRGVWDPLLNKAYQRSLNLPRHVGVKYLEEVVAQCSNIRSVVRHSQTEPVVRVMLEGDRQAVDDLCMEILQASLG